MGRGVPWSGIPIGSTSRCLWWKIIKIMCRHGSNLHNYVWYTCTCVCTHVRKPLPKVNNIIHCHMFADQAFKLVTSAGKALTVRLWVKTLVPSCSPWNCWSMAHPLIYLLIGFDPKPYIWSLDPSSMFVYCVFVGFFNAANLWAPSRRTLLTNPQLSKMALQLNEASFSATVVQCGSKRRESHGWSEAARCIFHIGCNMEMPNIVLIPLDFQWFCESD